MSVRSWLLGVRVPVRSLRTRDWRLEGSGEGGLELILALASVVLVRRGVSRHLGRLRRQGVAPEPLVVESLEGRVALGGVEGEELVEEVGEDGSVATGKGTESVESRGSARSAMDVRGKVLAHLAGLWGPLGDSIAAREEMPSWHARVVRRSAESGEGRHISG